MRCDPCAQEIFNLIGKPGNNMLYMKYFLGDHDLRNQES